MNEEVNSNNFHFSIDKEIKQFYLVNNICDLKDKSPENVTRFIKYRFLRNQIYTWSGQTLIAVQPYRSITEKKEVGKKEPNVSAVVSRALFKLTNKLGKINQIIVISGDSGSGKTYSGCLALKYLALNHSYYEDNRLRNILMKTCSAATVLAAFGNASTTHNCNSSRFGKLTKMQCLDGKFVGSYVQTYLLEKSRVSGPNRGESNFHIFNQILNDLDDYVLERVYLKKSTEYLICPKITYTRKNSLHDLMEMMNFLDVDEINNIWMVLSLILNLGNIIFTCKDENLVIHQESKQYLNFCACILDCDVSCLSQLFTKRLIAPKLRRGSMCFTACVNIEECNERKNSLMRFLYEKLFDWLVEKLNEQTYCRRRHECLGILDIYGFEIFPRNTFEQLCINYANERLQQFFMNDYYNKQVSYLQDRCEKIAKYDLTRYNKRINLLDGPISIFGILNEECLVKRYNTDVFIATRLSNCLRKNEFFIDRKDFRTTKFSIRHYAGIVEYDTKSMVGKNRDKLPEEMLMFLKESKSDFLTEMLNLKDQELQISNSKTLLTKFKKSLDNLMASLNQSDTHYIKCLKPNREKLADRFDEFFFVEELRNNGIVDVLNLEFQNFSTVLSKTEFNERFDMKILNELEDVLKGKVLVGRDKIYFDEDSFSLILEYKIILMTTCARKIQRSWRKRSKRRNEAATCIQKFFRKKIMRYSMSQSPETTVEDVTVIENFNFRMKVDIASGNCDKVKIAKTQRLFFKGDRIISRMKLAEVPVRFHRKKTCLPFSYVIPIDEMPRGLFDIF